MKKGILIFCFGVVACLLRAQNLTCDTINSNKKMSYGISAGFILFPYASIRTPVKQYHAPIYLEDEIENLFYEPRYFLPFAEFYFSKKEIFYHLIGGSFKFRKFESSDDVTYKGLYIYYQNQFLLKKCTKIRFIKNLYVGGRFIITGKDMISYYAFRNGPNLVVTDKNFMSALGISFGFKKFWKRFFFDFGINRSVVAMGAGEYSPNYQKLSEKGKYFAFMTPFDNSYLRPLETNLTPVTFNIRIGYRIK